MTPVIIGDATLYLGDCRDILPTLTGIDAVITDPPYGIDYGRAGGFSASHGWNQNRENVEWDVERIDLSLIKTISEFANISVIWGGNYYTDILPPTMRWLIWDKVQRGFSLADCEMAWVNQNKASRVFSYGRGSESGFAPKSKENKEFINAHPTQKPTALMQWCITIIDYPATVLDPFMGSGTTGIACIRMGSKFIGIEKEEKYFDIAVKRITTEHSQLRLDL